MISALEAKVNSRVVGDVLLNLIFALFGLQPSLNTWLMFAHKPTVSFPWYLSILLGFGVAIAVPRAKSYRPIHFIYAFWMISFFAKFFF